MKPTAFMLFYALVTRHINELSSSFLDYHNIILPEDMKSRCRVRWTEQRVTDGICELEPRDSNTEFPLEAGSERTGKEKQHSAHWWMRRISINQEGGVCFRPLEQSSHDRCTRRTLTKSNL